MNKILPFIFPLLVLLIAIYLIFKWNSLPDNSKYSCDRYGDSAQMYIPARCVNYFNELSP